MCLEAHDVSRNRGSLSQPLSLTLSHSISFGLSRPPRFHDRVTGKEGGNTKSTGCNICGNHNRTLPRSKLLQDPISLFLVFVSVNREGRPSTSAEGARKGVCSLFSFSENQNSGISIIHFLENMQQPARETSEGGTSGFEKEKTRNIPISFV
jgi:hypothetical protein